jgi:hypothetical protein
MRAARGDAAAPPPPGGEPAYLLYYRGTLDAAELRELEFEGERPPKQATTGDGGNRTRARGRTRSGLLTPPAGVVPK